MKFLFDSKETLHIATDKFTTFCGKLVGERRPGCKEDLLNKNIKVCHACWSKRIEKNKYDLVLYRKAS